MDYIDKLTKQERARILEALEEVEGHGFGAVKVRFRQMVLLHAYKKQGQKLPLKERQVAIKRMKEVLS